MSTLNLTQVRQVNEGFLEEVSRRSKTDISSCYQCGKCTAGCPAAFSMDYGPRLIMRMVQLNLKEKALSNNTIWRCVSCGTCTARCPRDLDVARVMETLRIMARECGAHVPDPEVPALNDLFLDFIERYGRVHELELVLRYNMKLRKPFKDASLAPAMLLKGKLALMPKKVLSINQVRAVFEDWRRRRAEGSGQCLETGSAAHAGSSGDARHTQREHEGGRGA